MEMVMEAIKAIRNRRAEMNVPPSRKAKVYIAAKEQKPYVNGEKFIIKLASANEVEIGESFELEGAVTIVTADAKIYIPMDELVDKEAELKRLNKELETAKKNLQWQRASLQTRSLYQKLHRLLWTRLRQLLKR